MTRFRKKPVEIEAFQLTEAVAISNLIDDVPLPFSLGKMSGNYHPKDRTVSDWWKSIDTLEGWVRASKNDWIIKGVKGEIYPCKPDIFDMTYDRADIEPVGDRAKALEEIDIALSIVDDVAIVFSRKSLECIKSVMLSTPNEKQGFVLVPVEPDEVMIDAGISAGGKFVVSQFTADTVYKAMLAARPEITGGGE